MKRQGSVEASPDRSEDAGERFRVRVCMKQYFSDERALAFVCVRGGRRVRWLQRRLRALFPLPPRFALLCAGHLLPPDEPLAVLRHDDVVDVVPSHVDVDRHWAEGDDVDSVCRTVPVFDMSDSHRSNTVSGRDVTNRCSPTADREFNVVHAGDDVTPTPSRAAQEPDESDKLSERKRRALVLLEQYCGMKPYTEQRETRPRRRRVRRRRREPTAPSPAAAPAASPATSPAAATATSPATSPARHPTSPATAPAPLPPSGHEVVVLRNGIQISRTPRLIRPLADAVLS